MQQTHAALLLLRELLPPTVVHCLQGIPGRHLTSAGAARCARGPSNLAATELITKDPCLPSCRGIWAVIRRWLGLHAAQRSDAAGPGPAGAQPGAQLAAACPHPELLRGARAHRGLLPVPG